MTGPIIAAGVVILIVITLFNTARIVPQKSACIVERLGKERKFGLIVDSAALGVLYIESDFDLTDEVLLALAKGED